jgi:hypothetical protein
MNLVDRVRRSDLVLHGTVVFGGVVGANVFNYLYYMLIGRVPGVVSYGEVTSLASAMLVLGTPANVGQLIMAKLAADLAAAGDKAALRRLGDIVTGSTVLSASCCSPSPSPRANRSPGFSTCRPARRSSLQLSRWRYSTSPTPSAACCKVRTCSARSRSRWESKRSHGAYSGVALVASWGPAGALLGSAAGIALAGGYNWLMFRRHFGERRAPVPLERNTVGRVVSGVCLGQLTLTIPTFYDVPLVKHTFDARSAGLYAAAALVGRAVIAVQPSSPPSSCRRRQPARRRAVRRSRCWRRRAVWPPRSPPSRRPVRSLRRASS